MTSQRRSTTFNPKNSFVNTRYINPRFTGSQPGARDAKIEIRNNVLDVIGPDAAVFDAFGGAGEMYRAVWSKARRYVGVDLEWHADGREMFVGDNQRVLRTIDLDQFNIFDFDACGSPWEAIVIMLARRTPLRPNERFGLVITDGSQTTLSIGHMPKGLAALGGLNGAAVATTHARSVEAYQNLFARAVNATALRSNGVIKQTWRAFGARQLTT